MGWLLELLAKWGLGWLANWLPGFLTRRKLDQQTVRADKAEAKVEQQQQVIHEQEVRHDVEQQVEEEPAAPAQRVGDARPDTAAGRLRDWSRD